MCNLLETHSKATIDEPPTAEVEGKRVDAIVVLRSNFFPFTMANCVSARAKLDSSHTSNSQSTVKPEIVSRWGVGK